MNFNDDEYISDDYNPNDYEEDEPVKENKFIKGIIDNSLEKKGFKFNKSVDVRIILTNLDYIESISSTINNFDLSNFNVVISSIIPTTDFEIAKSTTQGADLLLIATEFNEDGKKLFYKLKNHLKTDYNYIEYLKLPDTSKSKYNYNYSEDEDLGEFFEDEIANSIIRAGLSCVSNLSVINHSKLKFFQIKDDFEKTSSKLEKANDENTNLETDIKNLRDKNEKLTEEVLSLQKELDKIKSDYSTYKSRFENIYSKDSLEIFDLSALWEELFDEIVNEELYKAITIATDEFKPTDLIVGQGFIGAKTKEDAKDWLKIIKTALIVNFKDFKPSKVETIPKTYSTSSYSSQNNYNNSYSSQNNQRDYNKEDEDDDLEIPNTFSNLW
ncbi:MAG: hypothetical protein Q4P14_05075 [Methanobacteriaceae archaeon]|nr:hypothetical protein [Methanobacteriaceae archaeon]